MQPYIFPYIGYFQLINAVDKFIILDDVNYINKGWINRNRIQISGNEYMFTFPLEKASQNKKINETFILTTTNWKPKFLNTLMHAYKNAPYFNDVICLIENTLSSKESNISKIIFESITKINTYLNIKTTIEETSSIYNNAHLKAQEKILDICLKEKATTYINPIGGLDLYKSKDFSDNQIKLNFLKTNPIIYNQMNKTFISGLSIIDILMYNSTETIKGFLNQYTLLENE